MQLQTDDIVFHNWKVNRVIGSGSFGTVYEIEREEFGRIYKAAAKVITIPDDSHSGFQLAKEGMTEENTIEYYKSLVDDIISECDVMERMKGDSHIVSFEDHYVEEKENGKQWTIYIRMELLKPLVSLIADGDVFLGTEEIICIGIDICKGLETCQKINVVHRDIKLENIFVSDTGNYKLGDFGISKVIEESELAVSQKGTKLYMAPEMFRGGKYDATVDIYSLGLVLYRLLNHNRAPFMPKYPQSIHIQDKENALQRRLSGEVFPPPANADEQLTQILQKACSYEAKERYQTPYEMRNALEKVAKSFRIGCSDGGIDYEDSSMTVQLKSVLGQYSLGKEKEKAQKSYKTVIAVMVFFGVVVVLFGVRNYQNHIEKNTQAKMVMNQLLLSDMTMEKHISKMIMTGETTVILELEKHWMLVPDLLAVKESRALELLLEAGYLKDEITITYKYSNDVPSGCVIAQSTEASTRVKKGTEIVVMVSAGSKPVYTTRQNTGDSDSNIKWKELE